MSYCKYYKRRSFEKGLINLSILHTSASLTFKEHASNDVLSDIGTFLSNLAPETANYIHNVEGPDDMPEHLKTLVTNSNLTLSVISNKLVLGVWQRIYLYEWRTHAHNRSRFVHLLGE